MKKLLFYMNTIHRGGAERVLVNLANNLAEFGYECVLVTSFRDEWEYTVSENVKRISLYEKKIEGTIRRNFRLTFSLRRLIQQEKADLLISFMAEPNFRALFAAMGLRTRNLISVRNDPKEEYRGMLSRFLAKTLFLRAEGIVFQTEEARSWFPKSIQKRSRVIVNPVGKEFFGRESRSQRKNIVTVGRLTAQKNQKLLIQTFAEIQNEISDDLYIYGEGELRENLQKSVVELGLQDRVFMPGNVRNVAEAICAAKVFALTSDFEGMPNALLEAMVLGLPCIATDCPCGGPGELIQNGKNGLMIPVGDGEALKKGLLRLCRDEVYAESLASCARKTGEERFSPDRVYGMWREYLEIVMAR